MNSTLKSTFFFWLSLFLLAPRLTLGADISLHAEISKNKAELGESLVYQLSLSLNGQTQFSPQIELPSHFDGFQIRQGPQQQQSMNWVNGAVSQTWVFSWELAPIKSGTLHLPKVQVRLRDPQGDMVRQSEELSVEVTKAKAFSLPPTPTQVVPDKQPAPSQTTELKPLKPDLGLPLMILGGIFLAVVLAAGVVLWLIFRPAKPKPLPVVRNPGQVALYELEQAKRLLQAGKQKEYFLEASRILRTYFRHILNVSKPEPTLMDLEKAARSAFGGKEELESLHDCFQFLMLVLFGNYEANVKESEAFPEQARQVILSFESIDKKSLAEPKKATSRS